MNKRKCGAEYENIAIKYLQQKGLWILEHNYRTRYGEIDIICKENEYIVFIEVKYRKNLKSGSPLEAVNQRKQQIIRKVADYYRMKNQISEFSAMRFDVVGICGEEITWIKNAF